MYLNIKLKLVLMADIGNKLVVASGEREGERGKIGAGD